MKTVRKAQKLRRFAAAGAETFSGVSRWYDNDARWRIFNVLAWARPFARFELLFSPDAPGECRVFLGWSERIKARPNQSKAAVDSAVAISALAAVRH